MNQPHAERLSWAIAWAIWLVGAGLLTAIWHLHLPNSALDAVWGLALLIAATFYVLLIGLIRAFVLHRLMDR